MRRRVLALFLGVSLFVLGGVVLRIARTIRSTDSIGREVFAFYNGWYEQPLRWRNAQGKLLVGGEPAWGYYDSRDTVIIGRQVAAAIQAGITGFAASWAGREDTQDSTLRLLMPIAAAQGLRVAVFLEHGRDTLELTRRIGDALERFGASPAYARTPDGRRILLVYIKAALGAPLQWWARFQASHPDLLIAAFTDAQTGDDGGTFPVSWYYSYLYDPLAFRSVSRVRADLPRFLLKNMVRRAWHGRAFACTVEPGFDNTTFATNFPANVSSPVTARDGGLYYRARWDAALKAGCPWVLITSWNEWFERTAIEPSRLEGDQYVRITREYTDAFLHR